MNTKRKIILVISIIGVILCVSGITYSFLRYGQTQTNSNVVTTLDCLNISISSDNKEQIELSNAYPISDEEGLSTDPYTFTISNECNDTPVNLSIKLEELKINNQLNSGNIKVSLEGDNGSTGILSSYESATPFLSNDNKSYTLANTVIDAGGQTTYSLKLWIDEKTTIEALNKVFNGKIVVSASPHLVKEKKYTFTGSAQEFVAPNTGKYTIELWGASGGSKDGGGLGGYTKGVIKLNQNEKLYIYVGGKGTTTTGKTGATGGYNGGGAGGAPGNTTNSEYTGGPSGGGATDVRLVSGTWDNQTSLNSRIMVAGGGGGRNDSTTGHAGGLSAYDGLTKLYWESSKGVKGTQTSGYAFGIGGAGDKGGGNVSACTGEGGGGGGYYGGTGGLHTSGNCYEIGGGGGSSYISGHTGCVAITSESDTTKKSGCSEGTTNNSCSIHYSGKYFTETLMIDGSGFTWTTTKASTTGTNLMPKPDGTTYASGVGHTGDGYAKISY